MSNLKVNAEISITEQAIGALMRCGSKIEFDPVQLNYLMLAQKALRLRLHDLKRMQAKFDAEHPSPAPGGPSHYEARERGNE